MVSTKKAAVRTLATQRPSRSTKRISADETLQNIAAVLRQRITTHTLAPGIPLRETDLAEEFRVSRARIREVLGMLEKHGMVERVHNRGARVKTSDFANLLEIFGIREVLEGLVFRTATDNAEPSSWHDLRDLFGEPTGSAIAKGDYATYFQNSDLLRSRVLAAARSPTLEVLLKDFYDRTKIAMRRIVVISERGREALEEHRAVIQAMCDGDGKRAELLKRRNIANGRKYLERYHEYIL